MPCRGPAGFPAAALVRGSVGKEAGLGSVHSQREKGSLTLQWTCCTVSTHTHPCDPHDLPQVGTLSPSQTTGERLEQKEAEPLPQGYRARQGTQAYSCPPGPQAPGPVSWSPALQAPDTLTSRSPALWTPCPVSPVPSRPPALWPPCPSGPLPSGRPALQASIPPGLLPSGPPVLQVPCPLAPLPSRPPIPQVP